MPIPTTYGPYTTATDIVGGAVNPDLLVKDIEKEASITTGLIDVRVRGDGTFRIIFADVLSGGEKAALDGNQTGPCGGIIGSHSAISPVPYTEFRASRAVTNGGGATPLPTSNYGTIGAPVITDPGSPTLMHKKDKNRAVGIATGKYRNNGNKCYLKIVESDLSTEREVSQIYELADSGGAWVFFQFKTNAPPAGGLREYLIKGWRDPAGSATMAEVGGVTLNLSEILDDD